MILSVFSVVTRLRRFGIQKDDKHTDRLLGPPPRLGADEILRFAQDHIHLTMRLRLCGMSQRSRRRSEA